MQVVFLVVFVGQGGEEFFCLIGAVKLRGELSELGRAHADDPFACHAGDKSALKIGIRLLAMIEKAYLYFVL